MFKKIALSLGIALALVAIVYAATVTVTWQAPTTNTDGTAYTDPGGFKVYYGPVSRGTATHPSVFLYPNVVTVASPTATTFTFSAPTGTYYMSVTAFNTSGVESNYSNEILKHVITQPGAPALLTVAVQGVTLI